MVLSHFVIMVQNCGTPSQQRLRSLKIYTISRKILLNGAHQLNVMCSSYSDVHDIYIYIFVIGFNHGLPCYVKNMARGTQVDKNRGRRPRFLS